LIRAILAAVAGLAVFVVGFIVGDYAAMRLTMPPDQIAEFYKDPQKAIAEKKIVVTGGSCALGYGIHTLVGLLSGLVCARIARNYIVGSGIALVVLIGVMEAGGAHDLLKLVPWWWVAIGYPWVLVGIVVGLMLGRTSSAESAS
jgi:hypothetical protein